MSKQEHSPLNWSVRSEAMGAGYIQYAIVSDSSGLVADVFRQDATGGANAALIVRSVNSHAALVAALQAADQAFALQALRDCADPEMLAGWRKLQEQARAALAQAGS